MTKQQENDNRRLSDMAASYDLTTEEKEHNFRAINLERSRRKKIFDRQLGKGKTQDRTIEYIILPLIVVGLFLLIRL